MSLVLPASPSPQASDPDSSVISQRTRGHFWRPREKWREFGRGWTSAMLCMVTVWCHTQALGLRDQNWDFTLILVSKLGDKEKGNSVRTAVNLGVILRSYRRVCDQGTGQGEFPCICKIWFLKKKELIQLRQMLASLNLVIHKWVLAYPLYFSVDLKYFITFKRKAKIAIVIQCVLHLWQL